MVRPAAIAYNYGSDMNVRTPHPDAGKDKGSTMKQFEAQRLKERTDMPLVYLKPDRRQTDVAVALDRRETAQAARCA